MVMPIKCMHEIKAAELKQLTYIDKLEVARSTFAFTDLPLVGYKLKATWPCILSKYGATSKN